MELRQVRTSVNERTYWQDTLLLLHPSRFVIIVMFMLMGAYLAPSVDLIRFVVSVVIVFSMVALGAYRLDELLDNTTATSISNLHHKFVAGVGIAIGVILAVWQIYVYSIWLSIYFAAGLIGAIGYNVDIRLFKNMGVYTFTWGCLPIIFSYSLQTLEIPPLYVWFIGLSAALVSALILWGWGLRTCGRNPVCRKYESMSGEKLCHSPVVKCKDRLIMPKEINEHMKILLNLLFGAMLLLTIAVIMLHYGV